MARCPVLYVHGNHDGSYRTRPPEGCDCIDEAIVEYNGLRILGLGGCLRYHPGEHQYTEKEMRARIRQLKWRLKLLGGVDIVVTHAPPAGLGDGEDPAHWGFAALRELLDQYHPQYLIHGHVHTRYGAAQPRTLEYGPTTIVNACERYVLDIQEPPCPNMKKYGQVIYRTRPKNWYKQN